MRGLVENSSIKGYVRLGASFPINGNRTSCLLKNSDDGQNPKMKSVTVNSNNESFSLWEFLTIEVETDILSWNIGVTTIGCIILNKSADLTWWFGDGDFGLARHGPVQSNYILQISLLLTDLNNWFQSNLLNFNPNKTNYLEFKPTKRLGEDIQLKCDNTFIPTNTHTKFLGLIIDNNSAIAGPKPGWERRRVNGWLGPCRSTYAE